MALLRKDGWIDQGFAVETKLQVDVREPATRHIVMLSQVERRLMAQRAVRTIVSGKTGCESYFDRNDGFDARQ